MLIQFLQGWLETEFGQHFLVFIMGEGATFARNGDQSGFHHIRAERTSIQHRRGGYQVFTPHLRNNSTS